MIVYGRNPVREALRGPRDGVARVGDEERGAGAVARRGAAVAIAGAEEIERLSGSDAHQGVCAEVAEFRYADGRARCCAAAPTAPLLVALDQVTDPQNLGAICRTAECAGASGVVLPERRSAEVTPAVCKASAGAVEHLPIAQVRNLADWLGEAKAAGLWCYGADADGEVVVRRRRLGGPSGARARLRGTGAAPPRRGGLRRARALPLRGRIESLSVSAAAAVLLYAAAAVR